ncbi:MAG TPA: GNAT family N-acetyltransferase [Gammaproteobacteria bacterium]|nr:GNAT family N-acetyltransferase [Gammaproteobacteria bacterium]
MYTYSTTPRHDWVDYCKNNNAFIHSAEWQSVLESAFNCKAVYSWNPDTNSGLTITVFKAGPFKIGYLGFPTGNFPDLHTITMDTVHELCAGPSALMPHCLRIPVSAFTNDSALDYPGQSQPETAILDLQDWELASVSKKLRRDLKKVQKAGFQIHKTETPSDGRTLFNIYQATVKSHGGSLRYNARYFTSLIALSAHNPNVLCLTALKGGKLAGFLVVCMHMYSAYYLHGGTAPEFRRQSPSDLLVHQAIEWSKKVGAHQFNLMTSPRSQPSLVRYKEKWGAETREHKTLTVPLNRPFYAAFKVAEKLHRFLR